jgi:hypothetical protein
MQNCPKCNRTYPDDAPAFCPNDGTRLLRDDQPPAYDLLKTVISTPNQAPAQTAPPPPTQPPPQWQMPAAAQQQGWQQPPQATPQNWGGGYYQQSGQNLPYGASYGQPSQQARGLSIASMIIGIVCCAIMMVKVFTYSLGILPPYIALGGSIVAIILGIIALTKPNYGGKPLAIVGILTGAPAVVLYILHLIQGSRFF